MFSFHVIKQRREPYGNEWVKLEINFVAYNGKSKFCPGARKFLYYRPELAFELSLQWCHNKRNGVPNHRRFGCLLNRFFRRRSKKTSKLRVTDLCEGISRWPVYSPHKGTVTRKMFPYNDVIMYPITFVRRLVLCFCVLDILYVHCKFSRDIDLYHTLLLHNHQGTGMIEASEATLKHIG